MLGRKSINLLIEIAVYGMKYRSGGKSPTVASYEFKAVHEGPGTLLVHASQGGQHQKPGQQQDEKRRPSPLLVGPHSDHKHEEPASWEQGKGQTSGRLSWGRFTSSRVRGSRAEESNFGAYRQRFKSLFAQARNAVISDTKLTSIIPASALRRGPTPMLPRQARRCPGSSIGPADPNLPRTAGCALPLAFASYGALATYATQPCVYIFLRNMPPIFAT